MQHALVVYTLHHMRSYFIWSLLKHTKIWWRWWCRSFLRGMSHSSGIRECSFEQTFVVLEDQSESHTTPLRHDTTTTHFFSDAVLVLWLRVPQCRVQWSGKVHDDNANNNNASLIQQLGGAPMKLCWFHVLHILGNVVITEMQTIASSFKTASLSRIEQRTMAVATIWCTAAQQQILSHATVHKSI